MRKHKLTELPQYGIKYRPLTVGDMLLDECIVEKPANAPRHQTDYAQVMALFAGKGEDSTELVTPCPACNERVFFTLNKNAIMVEELETKVFGNDIKISILPYSTGQEEIPELIEFVVIDDEQIFWKDCSEREKEAVLDSIDFAVYKQINTALQQPAPVANVPVRCSCGHEHIVRLRGLETFLKVV